MTDTLPDHPAATLRPPAGPAARTGGTPAARTAGAAGRGRPARADSPAGPTTRPGPRGVRPGVRLRGRTASVVATGTWLLGAATIASAVVPVRRERLAVLAQLVPERASATAAAVAAALGVLLLYLAGGLRRRKRRAWRAAVGVTAAVAVSHLLKDLDVVAAAVSVVLLGVLVGTRREFRALGDPTTRWLGLLRFAQLLVLDVLIGWAVLVANLGRVAGRPSTAGQLRQVLLGLVGANGPLAFTAERSADVVSGTLLALGLLTAFATAYFVLRPAEPVAALSPADEAALRALLRGHGARDSLGYFALRRDKSVVWSPTGKAAVTYRVVTGVLLASGDPIGDPEAWPGAITAALELARRHAWVPAVMGCSELGARAWARYGLGAYELGDEAVLDVATFTLDGRAMRGVRQAVGRVDRAGYQVSVRRAGDVPAGELAAIVAAAERWRGAAVERGFSMALSRLGDPADGGCVLVTATRGGRLRGVLSFVPWGPAGLSLDLMRRDPAADNGLNEWLIVQLATAAPALGVTRLSLNFAICRSALERGARIGAGPVSRAWRAVLVLASRWWQIETLYRFNAKFRPRWEPRYLSFPAVRDLPRIAVAALEAEAFLVRPRRLARLLRRPAPVAAPPARVAPRPAEA
jgi:lysyl-tRNA synthetase, class II